MHKQVPQLCFLILIFLGYALAGQAQDLKDPGEYLSFIGTQHREITKDYLSYASAVGHGKSARKVENRRKDLIKTVNDARQKVGGMPAFSADKSLRDSTAKYYLITYHVLNEDYGKILNLEDVAEQSYDAMEAYLLAQDLADKKIEEANQSLKATQKTFADKHGVKLIETTDELNEKAEKATKVNEYHRVIYLVFFKSYKQEAYLMDAFQKKDVNGIEQNKNTLLKYAEEGLEKLKVTPAIYSDNTLENGCRQALEFYRNECKNQIPAMTNYLLKEENFNKIKKAFDAKREKERTKEDIAQYNQAIDEMNKAGSVYNTTINQVNAARQKALDGWNKGSAKFLDTHTPKYR